MGFEWGPAGAADGEAVVIAGCLRNATAVGRFLHERGALDINRRVCEYIPGYEQHGKDEITVAHVLAHRAGVPNLPREAFDLDRVSDRDFIVATLSAARPFA